MRPEEGFTRLPNAAYGLLTEQEAFLWAYLEFRQGQNNSSHWSIPGIARQLHWSPSKVQRWTKSLVAKGWLKTWLDTHPVSGKTRKHYSVMNRDTSHQRPATLVTSDHLNKTRKNNQQTTVASAEALAPGVGEVFILEKLNELEISQPDILPAEVLLLDKQKDAREEGISRNTREKPFPESVALLKALPTEIASQITLTAEINSLVSQLLLTRGRSISELGINLAEEFRKPGVKNPGGFLTHLLRRYLENGYTPHETTKPTPAPPRYTAEEFETKQALSPQSLEEVKQLREKLRHGSKTASTPV